MLTLFVIRISKLGFTNLCPISLWNSGNDEYSMISKTSQKKNFALLLATHIPSGTKIIRSFYWKFNGKIKENSSHLNLMTSKNGKEFLLPL